MLERVRARNGRLKTKPKKPKVRREALTEDEIRAATEALQAEGQNPAAQSADDANRAEGGCSNHHHKSAHSNASGEGLDEDSEEAYVFDPSDLEDEWDTK